MSGSTHDGRRSVSARSVAARVLSRVCDEGAFSQHALRSALDTSGLARRERAWITATVYGVLSDLRAIDLALDRTTRNGVASLPQRVRSHLRLGVWALARDPRRDESAVGPVVSAVVAAVRADAGERWSGLVNGVLRTVLRDAAVLFAPPTRADATARFGIARGLPDWIAARVVEALGSDDAAALMAALNAPTPVALRVRRGSVDEAVAALAADGIVAAPHPLAPGAVIVSTGHAHASTLVQSGAAAIQDAGAQLAVLACPSLPNGARILDACAGVGGKTLAMLDRFREATVVACDSHAAKLEVVARVAGESAPRLSCAQWALGSEPAPESIASSAFDIVLVDAPCSALGTIGRHPEARWNRSADVVESLAALQSQILDAAASLVAPGGSLVYVVCTFTREETKDVVARFLATHPGFRTWPPTDGCAAAGVNWAALVDGDGAITLWPHRSASDGFYIARLRRET